MRPYHQLVDQPAEMLAVDTEVRQRLLVGADATHVLQPVVGGLAGEAFGAVFQHARGRRCAASGIVAEDVGEDGAEIDGGAGRLGHRAAVLAVGGDLFVGGTRRGDAEIDVAQCSVGNLQRSHQLAEELLLDAGRQAAQHGVHEVALLRARVAVRGAVEACEPIDQAADLHLELATHLGALDGGIANRGQALHQIGNAAVVGAEGLVPGTRRI